jgi:PAS domain S-box-containing protein
MAQNAFGRQAEQAMRHVPDLVAIIDEDGTLLFVSPSCLPLLGLHAEQAIGTSFWDLLEPDDRRNCVTWLAHAQCGGDVPPLTHRARRVDGGTIWFETRLRLMRRGDRRGPFVLVARDVSLRIAADRQLAHLTGLWSDVADVLREGVLVVDDYGIVLAANRMASELLRAKPTDLCGTRLGAHLIRLGEGEQPLPLSMRAVRSAAGEELLLAASRAPSAPAVRARVTSLPAVAGSAPRGRLVLLLEPIRQPTTDEPPAPEGTHRLLSPREVEVLRLLAGGLDVRGIALDLGVSVHTVRAYVKSILRKLNVRTQLQAVIVALRAQILELS